jgi:protein MpaA
MRVVAATALAALAGFFAVAPGESRAPARQATSRAVHLLGRSAQGRTIRVTVVGSPSARRRVLVVGCIPGTECAGMAVARRLARRPPPAGARLWIVTDLNPDGHHAHTRLNGRGVDLNRNFPAGWRAAGRRGDPEYPGPRPLSEPETRAIRALILRVRPDVTIWFHQPLALVRAWGRSVPDARRFAAAAALPFRRLPWLAGTAPNWQNHAFGRGSSFVVELAPGALAAAGARRLADAVRAVARRDGR